jgi:hypothetical protein
MRPPDEGSRSAKNGARGPRGQPSDVTFGALEVRLSKRHVAVRVHERRRLGDAVERDPENRRRRDTVVVPQRQLSAERLTKTAVDPCRRITAAAATEPDTGVSEIERVGRRDDVPLVLDHRDLTDVNGVGGARRLRRLTNLATQFPRLVQRQRVEDVVAGVAVDQLAFLGTPCLVAGRGLRRAGDAGTGIGVAWIRVGIGVRGR